MAITPIEASFNPVNVGSAATFRSTINSNFEIAKSYFNNDINSNLTDIQNQIDSVVLRTSSLESKVGNTSVSSQIDNKINLLDNSGETLAAGKIVDAWSETNGIVTITSRDITISESGGDIACVGTYDRTTNKLMTHTAVTSIQNILQGNINTVDGRVTTLNTKVDEHLSKIRVGGESSTTFGNIWVS